MRRGRRHAGVALCFRSAGSLGGFEWVDVYWWVGEGSRGQEAGLAVPAAGHGFGDAWSSMALLCFAAFGNVAHIIA